MTFDTNERSISDSAPVEIYDFVTPTTTYRLTTWDRDFVFGGNTYTKVPGLRSAPTISSSGDPPSLTVEVPAHQPVVRDNFFGLPPRDMLLTVRRVQQVSGAAITIYEGLVVDMNVENGWAKLRVPSVIDEPFNSTVPSANIQRLCNHVLYSQPICRVGRGGFEVATSVVSVNGVTIAVASAGSVPADWYIAGEMYTAHERRQIIAHSGTTFTIDVPFKALVAGNNITLAAGCDHTATTCRDKFGNINNFGGHPYIGSAGTNGLSPLSIFIRNVFRD